MTDYEIRILFDDRPDGLTVALPNVELDEAEAFTAQLRYDVEEAKDINAPVFTVALPDQVGSDLVLDPRHVRSIDLEPVDGT